MIYLYHAVRRGLEYASSAAPGLVKRDGDQNVPIEIPEWGTVIMIVTAVVAILFMAAVDYTLENVVATLAMVETPSSAIAVSASDETPIDEAKGHLLETGPTITLVAQKPFTSSIRGTVRHLVSQGGFYARWRGFKSLFLYQSLFGVLVNMFDVVIPTALPGRLILISGAAGALLANIHAAWTHKVVAMPSQKSWRARLLSRSEWKTLAFPAAVQASAKYVALYIGQISAILLRLDRLEGDLGTQAQITSAGFRALAAFLITVGSWLFIVLPAIVTLIRIEASMLPEDEDTIVPFDRTFAGKVVPKVLGGTGCVGFVDAWKSFNWEARRRLLMVYAKSIGICILMMIAFFHVILFEAWAILGDKLPALLTDALRNY